LPSIEELLAGLQELASPPGNPLIQTSGEALAALAASGNAAANAEIDRRVQRGLAKPRLRDASRRSEADGLDTRSPTMAEAAR
jgi:hypothetical protein